MKEQVLTQTRFHSTYLANKSRFIRNYRYDADFCLLCFQNVMATLSRRARPSSGTRTCDTAGACGADLDADAYADMCGHSYAHKGLRCSRAQHLSLLSLLLVVLLLSSSAASETTDASAPLLHLRGVNPAHAAKYSVSPDTAFVCPTTEGGLSMSLPWSKVAHICAHVYAYRYRQKDTDLHRYTHIIYTSLHLHRRISACIRVYIYARTHLFLLVCR